MNIQVRYYTRSGHTEKLANAIAEAVEVCAEKLDTPMTEKADILFLGCSYYAFDMDEAVKKFLTDNKDMIDKIVLFGTSAMMKSMKKPMKKVAEPLGIAISDEEFHCRGEFKMFNKGRPNTDDTASVAKFAKSIVDDDR